MDFLIIFTVQVILMIIGYLVTILIGVKNKIESLGLSYLLGSGIITILFLINHFLFKVSLGSDNFLISSVGLIIVLLTSIFLLKKQKEVLSCDFSSIKKSMMQLSFFEKFALFFLVIILAYTLLENYIWPITSWDSLALYDFRARVMATNGNMLEGIKLGYFFQYPPYTSFLHVFGYVFGTERVKIVYSFIYSSLLVVFFSLLKRKQARWVALLGTLMLATDTFIFRHATMAYTNMPYTVFLSLGIIYLGFWLINIEKKNLILGGILVAMSTWVRTSDPFWYIGMLMFIFGILKNKKHILTSFCMGSLSVIMYKIWDIFVASLHTISSRRETKYINAILSSKNIFTDILYNTPEVVLYFYNNLNLSIGYLMPLLLFTIFYDIKYKNSLNKYLYLFIFISLLVILAGIFIYSLFFDTWNQIGGSLQRMSMALIPIIIFIIFNSSIWKQNVLKK